MSVHQIYSFHTEYTTPIHDLKKYNYPHPSPHQMSSAPNEATTAYLRAVSSTLLRCLDRLPGDARTQLAIITFNGALHLYQLDGPRPRLLVLPDMDGDPAPPVHDGLLVPLADCRDALTELLETLPDIAFPAVPGCCLGAALAMAHRCVRPLCCIITMSLRALQPTAMKYKKWLTYLTQA